MPQSAKKEVPFYLKITRKLSSLFSFSKPFDTQPDFTTRSNVDTKSVDETYLEKLPKQDSFFSSSPASGSVINGHIDQETRRNDIDIPHQPSIALDITLHDLYALDNNPDEVVLVYALPSANTQMTTSIKSSTKYAYQAPLEWTDDNGRLARMNLQVVPQFFGFLAGKMDVVLFDLENEGTFHRGDARQTYKHDSAATFTVRRKTTRYCATNRGENCRHWAHGLPVSSSTCR